LTHSVNCGSLSSIIYWAVLFLFLDRVVDEMNQTENFSKNEIQSLICDDWVRIQNFTTHF